MNIYLNFKLSILAIISISQRYLIYPAVILLILYFLPHNCPAHVTQEWVEKYPDTNTFDATAYALATDDSGNVFVTGNAETAYWCGYCTIKYNPSGIQQWVAIYSGQKSGGRYAFAIALDSYFNVYVTGYSYRYGSYFDYCTIKYNSNGVQQWIQYYDGPAHGIDQAQAIVTDNAGNIYVTGFSSIDGGYNFSYTTIKYSSDGRQLWTQSYGYGMWTYANAMKIDDSCNVYVTGENNANAVTIKYDSTGRQVWVQSYSGLGIGGRTGTKSIDLDNYHNVYITGFSQGIQTLHDYFTIKYSSSGVQQWVKRYNIDSTDGDNEANSIAVDNADNVYVSGFSYSNSDPMKLTTLKYSNSGDLLWVKRDSSILAKMTTYMDIDRNCNIYVTGGWGLSIPHEAFLTIKYDSSGNQQYKIVYYVEDDISDPNCIKLDDKFNVYLSGSSSMKMCTIKYSQTVGVIKNGGQIPGCFKLYQNYPNPFNPTTKIKFEIPLTNGGGLSRGMFTKLTVYDILGRKIAVLIDQSMKPGTYEVEWDASNYPSGVYFYKLTAGDFTQTKKMVLLK
jgi:hypothetical protein